MVEAGVGEVACGQVSGLRGIQAQMGRPGAERQAVVGTGRLTRAEQVGDGGWQSALGSDDAIGGFGALSAEASGEVGEVFAEVSWDELFGEFGRLEVDDGRLLSVWERVGECVGGLLPGECA